MTHPGGTTTRRLRVLIVGDMTGLPSPTGTLVARGTIERMASFAERFETGWTMIPSSDRDRYRNPLPDFIRPVWLPSYASKWNFIWRLPKTLRMLRQAVGGFDLLLVIVPSFQAIPALVVARMTRKYAFAIAISTWGQMRKLGERTRAQRATSLALMNITALLSNRLLLHGFTLADEVILPLRRKTREVVWSSLIEDDFHGVTSWNSDRIGLLCVSRLVDTKRVDVVITATHMLRTQGHDARLTVAGDGYLRGELSNLVDRLGLSDYVDFIVVDGQAALRPYYRSALATVLASEEEGFPLAVMEAMANGTPVISTPVGGLGRFLDHETNALVVGHPDPTQFAESILRLRNDPALREKIAETAQRQVRDLKQDDWLDLLEAQAREVLRSA